MTTPTVSQFGKMVMIEVSIVRAKKKKQRKKKEMIFL
jgi:hypothetical protein